MNIEEFLYSINKIKEMLFEKNTEHRNENK